MEMDLWTYEREQWNSGFTALCGVDEAGAGPLAGPVYAAAVILPREIGFPGLNDSKKLTAKKRDVLFDQITATAEAYSIAFVTAEEIDSLDILNARMLAMNRAPGGQIGSGFHRRFGAASKTRPLQRDTAGRKWKSAPEPRRCVPHHTGSRSRASAPAGRRRS